MKALFHSFFELLDSINFELSDFIVVLHLLFGTCEYLFGQFLLILLIYLEVKLLFLGLFELVCDQGVGFILEELNLHFLDFEVFLIGVFLSPDDLQLLESVVVVAFKLRVLVRNLALIQVVVLVLLDWAQSAEALDFLETVHH